MSTVSAHEETQIETQETEVHYEETQNLKDEAFELPVSKAEEASAAPSSKVVKVAPKDVEREPGKSLFPFSKVQRIIKADKLTQEIAIVAKEATFLISLAAEEFIKRLCQAGQQVAQNERRSTVQHKDLVTVVRKADEFLFLEEIMILSASDAPVKRPKVKMMDHFVGGNKGEGAEDDGDIVMNEDGTMYAAGNADVEDEL